MSVWSLPERARIGGREYRLHTDYRDILEIFSYLNDPDIPEQIRWRIALGLFYEEEIPEEDLQEAVAYFVQFLNCGQEHRGENGRLLCWEQDGAMIVAEVNKAAGREIRALPYLHWWTFMGWFHTIGEGQFSTVVAIRRKLRKGQSLDKWEKTFYRENRELVDLKKRYSREELQQQQKLQQLLG